MRPRLAYLIFLFLAGIFTLANGFATGAQEAQRRVHIAEVRGVISPPVASYISRILAQAADENALLVIIEMDTPGGLDTSMREIIQAILRSPVPVAVYITPAGGRAASAGLFILMAADIAAMAPNTNTGAAHPVALGSSADETGLAKAENDAAALIRSLAVRRGRNVEWAELAVRESISVSADEALELNIIEIVAADRDDLLKQIDGQSTDISGATADLKVADVPQHEVPMSLVEQLLHIIADPNLAFILLSIGSIGIIAELYNPGTLFPGITGVISLIIAFYALGNLPTNWAGVALIVVAMLLLIAELNTDGIGILAAGGTVAFLLGGMILFRPFQPESVALPSLRISPLLLGTTTIGIVGFFALVIRQLVIARNSPLQTGYEQFAGQTAQVRHEIAPQGRVWFQGQNWLARTESGEHVAAGSEVQIVGVDNLTLIVEPLDSDEEEAGQT